MRDTVFLATVLFLVGISSHFPLHQARYGLVGDAHRYCSCSPWSSWRGLPEPP